MKKRGIGLLIAVALLLIVIAVDRNDIQFAGQDNFKLMPIGNSGYELQSVLHIKNPNLLSSTIKIIHEDFYVNGKLAGSVNNELQQGIAGRKESQFPVAIRFGKEAVGEAKMDSVSLRGAIEFNNFTGGGKIAIQQSNVSVNL